MSKGLEAITSPISSELRNGKQYYTYTKEDVETIEQELKALKIIKEKKVNVGLLSKAFTLENGLVFYNENIYFANGILSLIQEEYDLLKEVLL